MSDFSSLALTVAEKSAEQKVGGKKEIKYKVFEGIQKCVLTHTLIN